MKLALHITQTSWEGGPRRLGPVLGDIVEAAENAGFSTISVADHVWLHPIIGGPIGNHVEAYTTLGFIAAHTRRDLTLSAGHRTFRVVPDGVTS
jgi:alkanesulfonate monooxygenase SsuD/methylene tetrahydromethanopterin reductase-like flavin-dependent oxidoreductase (luciferase family)